MNTKVSILVSGREFASELEVMRYAKQLATDLRSSESDTRAKRLSLGRFLLDAKKLMGASRFELLRRDLEIHRATAWRSMGLAQGVLDGLVTEKQLTAPLTQRKRSSASSDVEQAGGISLRQAEVICGVRNPKTCAPMGARVLGFHSFPSGGAGGSIPALVGHAPAGQSGPAGRVVRVRTEGDARGQFMLSDLYEAAERAVQRLQSLIAAGRSGDDKAKNELALLLARFVEG